MGLRTLLRTAALVLLLVLAPAGAASAAQDEGGGEEPEISHAAEECIHILEDGGSVEECQEAPNPILPEANELIWGALSFILLLGLLWKFAFPAVKQGMDARSERIRSSLDEAEQARSEASTVLEDYQRQLADARNESARIIEEARQTADALKRDLQTRAEQEMAELRQRNADQIAAERDRVMAELSGQVKTLAIELAEKVVEANLDRDANLRIIENYINSVGASGTR